MSSSKFNPVVFRFSFIVSAATLFLIFMGGLVTSTGSGLSVPDWPLSFGQVFPPMVGGVVFEHTHRLIAAAVGMLTIALIILLQLQEDDRFIKRAAWNALALIILQGTLGGMTVLMGLPPIVSILHACIGQAFLCLMVTITVWTSEYWKAPIVRRATAAERLPLHQMAIGLAAMIFVQLILGASLRHGGHGLHPHIGLGIVVAIVVHWIYKKIGAFYRGIGATYPLELKKLGLIVLIFTDTQVLLGLSSYIFSYTRLRFSVPPFFTVTIVTVHVMIGALLLALSTVLSLVTHRTKPDVVAAS